MARQPSLASTNVSGLIRLRGGDLITVRLLVAVVLLLAAPAGAVAAPFGELPSQRTGRALLTWAGPASRDGVWSFGARSATLPLAGGAAETHAHGAGVRDADSVTPLGLANGGAAALWTDDVDERDSRLHLAVEGAAGAADPPGPRVRIRPLSKRVLGGDDALVLRVTCSAACEVRAQTGTGLTGANGTLARARAGSEQLRLEPSFRPIASLRGGPVRVRVRSGAPGARSASVSTLTVSLRRRPAPKLPRVVGAVARRDGGDLIVTWRTTRDADRDAQFLFAMANKDTQALSYAEPRGGPRRFRARLRDARQARYVSIFVSGETVASLRRTQLRVPG